MVLCLCCVPLQAPLCLSVGLLSSCRSLEKSVQEVVEVLQPGALGVSAATAAVSYAICPAPAPVIRYQFSNNLISINMTRMQLHVKQVVLRQPSCEVCTEWHVLEQSPRPDMTADDSAACTACCLSLPCSLCFGDAEYCGQMGRTAQSRCY